MNGVAATEPEPAESALMSQGGSIGEIIRRKQEELKQKLVEMARADSLASTGLASAPPVPVLAPPGMEGPEMRRPARKCKSRQCKETHEKKMTSTGIQTTISLPHTMREVLWTASSFEPMIDGNESEGVTGILDYPSDEAEPPKHHLNDEVSVGSGVLDLDVLSEENEEEDLLGSSDSLECSEKQTFFCDSCSFAGSKFSESFADLPRKFSESIADLSGSSKLHEQIWSSKCDE